MAKAITLANAPNRGPQIINKSENRLMRCHLITEVELKGLGISDFFITASFGIGSTAGGLYVTFSQEVQTNAAAAPWAHASLFVAIAFGVFFLVSLYQRYGIVKEIRHSSMRQQPSP